MDSTMFGEASDLLGGPFAKQSLGHTLPLSDLEQEGKVDEFVLGGLLGGGGMKEATDQGFGESSLPEDSLNPEGLLSDASVSYVPVTSSNIQFSNPVSQNSSTQEFQENDLPDIGDILGQYDTSSSAGPTHASTSLTSYAPSIRATTYDGKPFYLRRKARKIGSVATSSSSTRVQNIGKLLDMPMHRLMDELTTTAVAKLSERERPVTSTVTPGTGPETTMWVDRYRPQRYMDLVGDDRVHREVMAWVKEWDFCVFGSKKGKKRVRDDETLDEYRRPNEKLLLISGPPGLGKTTLAHIVATQAGYNVFEINASDARTAQAVNDRIRPALESGSMVGSTKPILVVIDEIDGATGGSDNSGGFIHTLVSLTHDIHRKKGRKKEQQAARPLLRPIICICNDLYASSLTKLRPHARIIRFKRPSDTHLVRRLRVICEQEGLTAESRALSALVGLAQGDWRGCLNTLQLIKARSTEVTETIVRRATAGMKEADMSQTAVLNDLFTPISRKRAMELGIAEEDAKYVARLCREIEGSGSLDRIAIGCFEHYVNLRRHDANFSRYLKANEWLSIYDVISGQMWAEREYSSMQYLPYMLVAFYPLFQQRGGPKVERPKVDWEQHTIMKTNEEIYRSLARGIRTACTRHGGAYRHFTSDVILQLEFAPLINRIISPPLRPVNKQVIKPDEKALLSRLVDIMVSLELRFVQDKSEDGQLMYRLDPPIDVFITYDEKRASDIAVSRYAVRHLVASEIDAKFIHREAEFVEKSKETKKSGLFNHAADQGPRAADGDGTLTAGSSSDGLLVKRTKKNEDLTEKAAVDFFGRPIVQSEKSSKPISKVVKKREGVAFKFREGNSAAVRKPVKVSAFL